VVVGGLVTSSLLTVLVIPALYLRIAPALHPADQSVESTEPQVDGLAGSAAEVSHPW